MRCLVTGASGFIGGTIVSGLKASGHEVVAGVRNPSAVRPLEGVEVTQEDVGDPNSLAAAATGCAVVIHTAGIADPRVDAHTLGWTHVAGTENVINASRAAGCRRLIYISCADASLYNGPRSFWNEDQAPRAPFGTHARTKLEAEELVRVSGGRGFSTIALRPALVWGPGDTTHLPGWREEAERGGIRLIGRGKQLMATTYTRNLAAAVDCALHASVPPGSVYCVVDTELSLSRDFFSDLSEALAWPPPRRGRPYRWEWLMARAGLSSLHPTQVIRRGQTSAFDMKRAKEELGYEPIVPREQGMKELASWYNQAESS